MSRTTWPSIRIRYPSGGLAGASQAIVTVLVGLQAVIAITMRSSTICLMYRAARPHHHIYKCLDDPSTRAGPGAPRSRFGLQAEEEEARTVLDYRLDSPLTGPSLGRPRLSAIA